MPACESNSARIEPSEATWLLISLCQLFRKSVEPSLLSAQCASGLSVDDFINMASSVGLAALLAGSSQRRSQTLVPAIACLESAAADSGAARHRWVIVLAIGSDECTLIGPNGTAETIDRDTFDHCVVRELITVRDAEPAAADPDAVTVDAAKFGFSWFIPKLLEHRAIWRDVIIASLCIQMMALAFPLFTQAILDKVIVNRTHSTLIALAVGMAIFTIFTAGLTWLRQYLVLHTGNRIDAVLGRHVFEHLLTLPLPYFQHRPTGVISARLAGIEAIREFVSSAAVTLILDLPFICIFLVVMFFYSAILSAIVVAILLAITACSLIAAPIFRKRLNDQFLRGAANQGFVTEHLAGMETVKSLQLEPQLNARYRDQLAAYLRATMRTKQLGNSYSVAANTLEQLMNLMVVTVGAYVVMSSSAMTVGMLVAFQMFATRISQPVLRMVGLWQQFQQAKLSILRLGDFMDAPTEPYRLERRRAELGECSVSMKGLAFRYGSDLPLLYENFNLHIQAGELIVVTGPSGVGKSTLAKLLLGFFQPTSGSIRLGTVDIRQLAANELRSYLGVVPQETTLFSGTILNNLSIANPYASFEQIVAACRMAEIHHVIEALPAGYQTQIGERGVGLSGGQKQRISIARALLKGPKVLIFDEATSSLDANTAEQLARTINALKGRATIICIAHSIPRGLQPDRVVRIGDKLSVVQDERQSEMAVSS